MAKFPAEERVVKRTIFVEMLVERESMDVSDITSGLQHPILLLLLISDKDHSLHM